MVDERPMRERFSALAGPPDGDWADIERRARRWRLAPVLSTAIALGLAVAGLAVGGKVIGVFDVEGKKIPVTALPQRERELLVTSMCQHLALRVIRNKFPETVCRDGSPILEEIANDGHEAHYRIRYPWGVTCLASGPAHRRVLSSFGCNVGAPNRKLVPTPKRPITVDMTVAMGRDRSHVRVTGVSGLAGSGVAKVELRARDGLKVSTDVKGHAYSLTRIPDRPWSALVALDDSGREIYRERLGLNDARPAVPVPPSKPRVTYAKSPRRPPGPPLQRASTAVASADVYRNGVVAFRFASTAGYAYRRLARGTTIDIACGRVAFSAGRWEALVGGTSEARLAPETRFRMDLRHGGMPSPPFAYCEIGGTYGRYWNDEEGPHELVEVPFSRLGARYFDERAAARDLAYLVRNKKMWPIRKSIQRGEPPPSAATVARIFGPRVEPLARRGDLPARGRVGVWTGARVIVLSERAPDGRLLFATMKGTRIAANNIRDLSFPF